jgi:predicted RNase H-like HicB family nuclease
MISLIERAGPMRYNSLMHNEFTAVVQRDGHWWIGWIEEIPGVNSQGESREELMQNLQSALREALDLNRAEARKAAGENFEEVRISA